MLCKLLRRCERERQGGSRVICEYLKYFARGGRAPTGSVLLGLRITVSPTNSDNPYFLETCHGPTLKLTVVYVVLIVMGVFILFFLQAFRVVFLGPIDT